MARISSSVNAITRFAAQSASSGRRFANGAIEWFVVHSSGSNVLASKDPTSRSFGYLAFIQAGVTTPIPAMFRPISPSLGSEGSLPSHESFAPPWMPLPSDLVKSIR